MPRRRALRRVTPAALALAVAAWGDAGPVSGDRIEHASVARPELVADIAGLELTVVTQPAFVSARGDDYLTDVDPDDRPHLYPARSFLAAGVPVAASSDAPFGPEDPWQVMRAAVDRRTDSGAVLGPEERISPTEALGMFLGPAAHPGGEPRRVAPGAPCDLVVLDCSVEQALEDLDASHVLATVCRGSVTYSPASIPGAH